MEPGPLRLAPILEASVETFRCAIIDTLSSVHLGKEGGHSNLVEIFRYIFARQSRLLLLLGQPLEVARRAVVFISVSSLIDITQHFASQGFIVSGS